MFDLEFESGEERAPLSAILIKDAPFEGPIVYTGPLDELFLSRFGRLPYRSLDFVYETHDAEFVLPCGTVNFTVTEDCTRVTGFKRLTGQRHPKDHHVQGVQPPLRGPEVADALLRHPLRREPGALRALPGAHGEAAELPSARALAEYRYYNMDVIVGRALSLADELVG